MKKKSDPTKSEFERTIVTIFKALKESAETLRQYGAERGEAIDRTSFGEQAYRTAFDIFEKERKKLNELICNLASSGKAAVSILDSTFWVSRFEFVVTNRGFCYLKPHASNENSKNVETEIRHAYYNLKYLLHRHQHHDKKLDSLTRIHKIASSSGTNPNSDPGINVAVDLLRDIKASLVNIKLNQTGGVEHATNTIRGISSYAISLIQQLKAEKILKINNPEHVDFVERETKYLECLVKSAEEIQRDKTARHPKKTLLQTNMIFVFLTIVMGPLILYGIEVAKLPIYKNYCIEDSPANDLKGIALTIAEVVCKHGMDVIAVTHFLFVLAAFLLLFTAAYIFRDKEAIWIPFAGLLSKNPPDYPFPFYYLTKPWNKTVTRPLNENSIRDKLWYWIKGFLLRIDLVRDNFGKRLIKLRNSKPIRHSIVVVSLIVLILFLIGYTMVILGISVHYFWETGKDWSIGGGYNYLISKLGSLVWERLFDLLSLVWGWLFDLFGSK